MRVITNFKTTLSASVTSTQTTIPLSSITTTDGHTIVMTDLDTIAYMVLEPGSAKMELISFTGISGLSLTGVTRGLAFYGASAAGVAANQYAHQAGSTVVLSNAHYYYDQLMDLSSDETITGLKTFPNGANTPLLGTSYVAPTAANQVASKGYADAVATGSATYDQNIVPGVAGETLVAGNLVYFKVADGRWWKTVGSTAATLNGVVMGFAQGAAIAAGSVNILLGGIDKNQSGLTAGVIYYAGNTAGSLSSSAGTVSKVVGQALTTTQIILNQWFNTIPTDSYFAAMAGNSVTIAIGSGNKYVSQTGLQNSQETYASSTGSANAYVLTLSPVPAALLAGQEFEFKANFTNTGAATLNVNSLGAIAIKKLDGATALAASDITSGQVVKVKYDGTNYQMISPVANTTSPKVSFQTTQVTVSNTTVETTLFTLTLAANTLGTANAVKITGLCSTFRLQNNGNTATFKLYYGTTVIATAVITEQGAGASVLIGGFLTGWIIANASTAAQKGGLLVSFGNGTTGGNAAAVNSSAAASGVGTATEDSTTALTIKLTATFSVADTQNNVTFEHAILEKIS